jgi:hypothetical protein
MRTLAHLVLGNTDLDWNSGEPGQRLEESLAMLRTRFCDTTPMLYSDCTMILNRASLFGLETRQLDIAPNRTMSGDILPLLAAQGEDTGPTLFLDLRNPLLGVDLISRATDLFVSHGHTPMIGIRTPRDHPFFLFTAGKLLCCGLLHLLESATCDAGAEVRTKPFFFDWSRHGLPACESLSPGAIFKTDISGAQWICHDAYTAQAAFLAPGLPSEKGTLLASSLPNPDQEAPTLILYQGGDGARRLATSLKGRLRLKLFSFDARGLRSGRDNAFECVQEDNDGSQAIFEQGMLQPGIAGWFYSFESAVDGGAVDVERPFQPSEPCWVGQRNQLNGETITGRQQLPDVWQPDLSLVLCRPDEAIRLEELLVQGTLQGLPLPGQGALETKLDFLRFKAVLRAGI